MKKHGEQIFNKIGNKGDLVRGMQLFGCTLSELKKMNTVDVLEIIGIDNALNS